VLLTDLAFKQTVGYYLGKNTERVNLVWKVQYLKVQLSEAIVGLAG